MTILATLIIGTIIGALVMALMTAGASDDAYRRGRLDERTAGLHRKRTP